MTPNQRIHLMAELWPAAAAALGCSPNDRERRLEEISRALGRVVDSASDIKTNADFDKVKGRMLALSRPADVNAQVRQENMPRTRLLVGICERRAAYGEGSFATLLSERFGTKDWEGLPDWQLVQLRDTLESRLHARGKNAVVPF